MPSCLSSQTMQSAILKTQRIVPRSFDRYLAFSIYLIFVWGFAYIRRDYLWITGDDPNLLEQSLLITKGFIPNIDFFSGYPGLSIHIHALIIKAFGVAPLSQHIYVALQATALGIVFFWIGRNVKPWLILLLLVFIYSQGMLLNPTPNPGYLFETAFILGLKKTVDYFKSACLIDASVAGGLYAIAFLAKQYGIFGPVCFFIASLALIDARSMFGKLVFGFALSVTSGAILYVYFGRLIPGNEQYELLLKNALLFIIPTVVGLISNFGIRKFDPSEKPFTLALAIKANLILVGSFLGVVLSYFIAVYGTSEISGVIREIMILAPRRINGYLLAVDFSYRQLPRSIFALLVLFLPLIAIQLSKNKYFFALYPISGVIASFLVFKSGNLSATPFISIAFVVLTFAAIFSLKGDDKKHLVAVLAGLAPCFLILTPYPNYAYHIPIVVFFILLCYPCERVPAVESARRFLPAIGFIPLCAVAFSLWFSMTNASEQMRGLKTYSFRDITFRTGDANWEKAIEEAYKFEGGSGNCSTYACRYLLLTQPSFTNYDRVIERPIGRP